MDYPDHLMCSICLELLFKPISLNPCGHVFCEQCLRRLFETSHSKISCPLCRKVIEACLPAEERAREVLNKYPAQVAERQYSEQDIAQPPSLQFQNCSAEPDCHETTLYIDYSTRWRLALWIFWLGAFGFLMVFSLNSFLNHAIHGGSPHHLPSHPHLSQNNDGLFFYVKLDGRDDDGSMPSTSATSTEDNFEYSSGDGNVNANKTLNYSMAGNVGQHTAGYGFPGYAAVRLRNKSSSVGDRFGNRSVTFNRKRRRNRMNQK